LAPPVDAEAQERLRAHARGELSVEQAREINRRVLYFRRWYVAALILAAEERRKRQKPED
jgi:hypothetical protein